MTDRILHTVSTPDGRNSLELRDTHGIHKLVIMHEQGTALSGTSISIPAHMANALLAATPAARIDGGGWINDPMATSTRAAKANHEVQRRTLDPKLLRDALTVALWGEDNTDASVAAERAAGVVERLLDPGNQVPPWTPQYAVSILKAKVNEDAVDPRPHEEAAARGVLGLPFHEEEKSGGATVNLDWQPTAGADAYRFRADLPSVPGPVHYGSPWTGPFDEAARAKAAEFAANEATDELIDVDVLDEDEQDDPKPEKKKQKEGKVKKDKTKPEKGRKPEKKVKPEKGNGLGRRIALLRYVVDHLDGDMPFPDGPGARGFRFYKACVESVETFIVNNSADALIYDPRGEAPSFGFGTPMDTLTVSELLDLAADIDATSFDLEREPGDAFVSLEDAVKGALHAVYEDVWAVIAHGISEEELTVTDKGRVELSETPADDDEPDEDEDTLIDG